MTTNLLEGRTAVVTGAAQGIGLRIAERFAEHGAAVALLDINDAQTKVAAQDIARTWGVPTFAAAVDVTNPEALSGAANSVEQALGVPDLIVPNAGVLVLKPALEISPDEFANVLRVNLYGAFLTATQFAARMVEQGKPGQIIFTSSLFGTRGGAGNAAYSASKFGVIGLSQSLAADLAPATIRVNAVCPGQIDSRMLDQLFEVRAREAGTSADEQRRRFIGDIPLGMLGDPSAVADTYVYLASTLSSYVTGQHVVVDGGWSVG